MDQYTNLYPLSFQFNRKACKDIMVSIYEFINTQPPEEQQGLYYQITNDFMDLFDKIQEDCDSMWQLGINNILTNGCLTPHPDCNNHHLFFSPGIPMEYIKYLMVQKLKDGVDINGYSWLKKRIQDASSDLINKNSKRLADRIIPFDEEYTNIILRYQRGGNTMERTISSLLNFKLQVILDKPSTRMPSDIYQTDFIYLRNQIIQNYQDIEETQSMRAFQYFRTQQVQPAVLNTPPGTPGEQARTPGTAKQGPSAVQLLKSREKGSDVEMEGDEQGGDVVGELPVLKRSDTFESYSTMGFPGSQNLSGMGSSQEPSDTQGLSDTDVEMGGGRKRKKKTRKRVYFKDLLDAPKKGGKRKKKTRKRIYFKDLLDDPVQSGGLIPRRIYFNDLL